LDFLPQDDPFANVTGKSIKKNAAQTREDSQSAFLLQDEISRLRQLAPSMVTNRFVIAAFVENQRALIDGGLLVNFWRM
jgi:hypothetical protein